MKQYKKCLLGLLLTIAAAQLHAQEPNTSTRLIDQYKNGTVPGMKFAPAASNAKPIVETSSNENTKESTITQIRKGTASGMKFAPGTSMSSSTARSTNSLAPVAKSNGNLTSDKAAVAVKTITPVVSPTLPTQETGAAAKPDASIKKSVIKTQ